MGSLVEGIHPGVRAGKYYKGWWKGILRLSHSCRLVYLQYVTVIPTVHGGVLLSLVPTLIFSSRHLSLV